MAARKGAAVRVHCAGDALSLASTATAIASNRTLTRAHPSVSPQNKMESWLYCSDLLLLVLGCAYTAFDEANFAQPVMITTETLLATSLFGGLLFAAALFLYDMRTYERVLRGVCRPSLDLPRWAPKKPP